MPGDSKQGKPKRNVDDEETNNTNTTEPSSDDDSKKNLKKPDEKKHNSGAADLEKVTDYAEEKEITSSSTELTDAIANIRKYIHVILTKVVPVLIMVFPIFFNLSNLQYI